MAQSEYNRGKKYAETHLSKFRSYKKDEQGRIIGYKHSGSKEVIGKLSQFKPSRNNSDSFYGGFYDVLKEKVKSNPVRKSSVRRSTTSDFGFDFGFRW